jgi:hypothetical protein
MVLEADLSCSLTLVTFQAMDQDFLDALEPVSSVRARVLYPRPRACVPYPRSRASVPYPCPYPRHE